MLTLAFTFMLVAAPPSVALGDGRAREPDIGAIVLGAGIGTIVGVAVGTGTSFALVYGTNDNGCYFGGCDAPLLSAVGFSVLFAPAFAVAGGTAGGIIGWSVTE